LKYSDFIIIQKARPNDLTISKKKLSVRKMEVYIYQQEKSVFIRQMSRSHVSILSVYILHILGVASINSTFWESHLNRLVLQSVYT